ncbi:MAG: cyclic peptide export ABC transporter, partial [Gammaproteobacteria bacterium]|nr:cyclic peptide export ABC transporter [Gammaproteobacteria bacterium]
LRRTLVKRVLDTDCERLEALGTARILASLNGDVGHVTSAFINLPAVLYGFALCGGGLAYLAWLSVPLFLAIAGWLLLTILVAAVLMTATHRRVDAARQIEDRLYQDYEDVVSGRKELSLNRARARRVYDGQFVPHAREGRGHEIAADVYNGLNENWANAMMLAAIGLCFYLSRGLGWVDTAVGATSALTILFLRTPLTSIVMAVPSLIAGSVALRKIDSLELPPHAAGFAKPRGGLPGDWDALRLSGVRYRYPGASGFGVGPLDVTLRRGETVFVIGGNGSGKSTLAMLLTGLHRPHAGELRLGEVAIEESTLAAYRQLFSSVMGDFHLFRHLLGPDGEAADPGRVAHWLTRLQLSGKTSVENSELTDTRLSQGQRKRLALLLAALEERPIIVLDEWAADQDPVFRRFFYRELLPEFKAAGKTVFAITHDEHYFDVADRVLKMDGGALVAVAAAQGLAG